ncbi:MAG: hypothetical protein AVDCRST_MAG70-2185 [uncultured Thermomicrobiales bacterium]|uniref:Uncharacterized protein n=1 Tax=uncultured Thermomicrobiales bacterium TaxID=1645740 RepID=A0A6J4V349_9BACT|nr:MAG: hypothetical protein AVDCRST_MAG70-2185 [uncultured Thermomicrobiales bacterium]
MCRMISVWDEVTRPSGWAGPSMVTTLFQDDSSDPRGMVSGGL